ncbi:hypothetical protein SO802_004048 [Lithocarpus litseifolius]|uniref:Transmembrane protein n=1 Tax=Lithocarpus litseifolius TaxID=425828 RepID=A0AAW2E3R2_9ROSI
MVEIERKETYINIKKMGVNRKEDQNTSIKRRREREREESDKGHLFFTLFDLHRLTPRRRLIHLLKSKSTFLLYFGHPRTESPFVVCFPLLQIHWFGPRLNCFAIVLSGLELLDLLGPYNFVYCNIFCYIH